MARTAQEIYDDIVKHMNKFNVPYSSWYAGIATDPKDRLFVEHNVDERNGEWAFESCKNSSDARAIEKALLELGCQGGSGGGDNSTKSCYIYIITNLTRQ